MFLSVLNIILGILSWALFIYCLIARKKLSYTQTIRLQCLGWMVCAFALFLPSLSQYLLINDQSYPDVQGILDTTHGYFGACLILLLVNLVLSVIVSALNRQKNK